MPSPASSAEHEVGQANDDSALLFEGLAAPSELAAASIGTRQFSVRLLRLSMRFSKTDPEEGRQLTACMCDGSPARRFFHTLAPYHLLRKTASGAGTFAQGTSFHQSNAAAAFTAEKALQGIQEYCNVATQSVYQLILVLRHRNDAIHRFRKRLQMFISTSNQSLQLIVIQESTAFATNRGTNQPTINLIA